MISEVTTTKLLDWNWRDIIFQIPIEVGQTLKEKQTQILITYLAFDYLMLPVEDTFDKEL